jgi:hypothetical protein
MMPKVHVWRVYSGLIATCPVHRIVVAVTQEDAKEIAKKHMKCTDPTVELICRAECGAYEHEDFEG